MALKIMSPQARSVKGRLAFLIETLMGLFLISVVNMLIFRSDIGFLHVRPHPYWLVVILISVRYGFFPGFFAGMLSGAMYFTFKAAAIPDISFIEIRSLELWGKPLLFWMVGMVLGEIRQGHIREHTRLTRELRKLHEQCSYQENELKAMEQAKEEMDTRIFSQEHTLSTIYEAAQALRSLNEESIYPAILDLLRQYLAVEECSIYMLENNAFQLKASIRTVSSHPRRVLSLDTEPLATAYHSQHPVTIDEALRDDATTNGILIAAPVLAANGSQAIGVLTVERMPFLKYNPTSIRMAALIADWCGASLENALLHKTTKDKLITDELSDAYNYKYFKRRLKEEFLRARRYKLELSVIHLEIPGFSDRLPEEQQATRIAFSSVIQSHLRNIDLVFMHETPGAFLILLPTTPIAGARIVMNNIIRAYQALVIMSFELDEDMMALKVGAAEFSEATKEPEDLEQAVREDLHDAVLTA